jgi:hypothetical protein
LSINSFHVFSLKGSNWPVTVAFYLANILTVKRCSFDTGLLNHRNFNQSISKVLNILESNTCRDDRESTVSYVKIIESWFYLVLTLGSRYFIHQKECSNYGGHCTTIFDAYYFESALCFVIGFMWLAWKQHLVIKLERLPKSVWKLPDSFIKKILANK